jgi:glycyl-tRNA synthetase beta chain
MADFLLEIGCEEIPARMIEAASVELGERVSKLLERERFSAKAISCFDTPRRLAVVVSGIPASQPDVTEQVTGPSAGIAFKDGHPTPAAHAFAKKAGVDVADLHKITTAKGEYLAATRARFYPSCCRKKSTPSIGQRICTGARRVNFSCVRCAGWWRCSTAKWSR